jgi:hypothetical protein
MKRGTFWWWFELLKWPTTCYGYLTDMFKFWNLNCEFGCLEEELNGLEVFVG